jgi:pimeloyl-ACP methyl ester carboxylesterase
MRSCPTNVLRAAMLCLAASGAVSLPRTAAAAGCTELAKGKCKIVLSTGITMAYVDSGPAPGTPVILIHGFTDSIRAWSFAMDALRRTSPDLRVIAVDLRSHGATSMPPPAECRAEPQRCFRPSDLANDIVAFMQAKGIRRANLVGHSLGAFVVQEIALSHPAMVEHAVLVGTSTRGADNPTIRDYVLRDTIEGMWKKSLEAKGKRYPDDLYELTALDADPGAEEWMGKNWDADPAADPATIPPLLPETARLRLGTWIGVAKAVLAIDNTERLKALKVPTLVVWGTQDTTFPDEPDQKVLKAALAEAAKASRTSIYWKQYGIQPLPSSGAQESDIGHVVQWDAPDAIAADVAFFVKTGAPTQDLPHSDPPPNVSRIVVEPGKATVVRFGP